MMAEMDAEAVEDPEFMAKYIGSILA